MTKRKASSKTDTSTFSKYFKWLWILALSGPVFFFALLVLVSFSRLPDTNELENPSYEYASLVFSSDLREMGRYFEKNRKWVTYDELNLHVVSALIATEDERFFGHSGIDPKGTLRAVAFLGKRGGASTITQQLAKLFFTKRSSNFFKRVWQKMQEWFIAIEFEKRYTKEEIIAMYLNKYDFLHDSNGISAAAETYFGKDQRDLNVEEAAMLIGMLKNPRIYNPKLYPENADTRRMVVLDQMRKQDMLTRQAYDSLKVLPLDLSNFNRKQPYDGPAPYFRAELTKWLKDLLSDAKYAKPGGGKYNVDTDGLRIYTTIDLDMQRHAEQAMREHMRSLQSRYFRIWRSKDPWSYSATKPQKRIRQHALMRMIRDSDRYKNLRKTYMTDVSLETSKTIEGSRLWDADIERMLGEKKKAGHLNQLLKQGIISKKQRTVYRQIMDSPHWETLQAQWSAFQAAVKKAFNKKARMRVFAYTKSGQRDTIMTPLDSIKYHRMHMQLGSMAIEPQSGYVRTWVGGIDHRYFKYDHIQSNRQVGSTFKPFVYATAIAQGMSPCWKVRDEQYVIPAKDPDFGLMKAWLPQNAKGTFSGEWMTLKEGLRQSKNSISVYLVKEMHSVSGIRSLASFMGIDRDKIPNAPSICLGSADLSVMDMTGAYATFANNGVYTEPIFVTRIEDRNGRLIYSAVPDQRQAIPPNYNYVMVDMLKYASSSRHYVLESEFGGKTGTTNDYVDGWFVGLTPNLVVGTWVGGEDPWIRFLTLDQGQGGVMARPYFEKFLKRVEADPRIDFDKEVHFVRPEGELGIEIDCSLYEQQQHDSEGSSTSHPDSDEFDEEFDQ